MSIFLVSTVTADGLASLSKAICKPHVNFIMWPVLKYHTIILYRRH